MSSNIHIAGFVANSGQRYVRVQSDGGSATLPYEAYSIANGKLAAALNAAGLVVFAKEELEDILDRVASLQFFDSGKVVEHSGWDGNAFGQLDGTVNHAGEQAPEVMFKAFPQKVIACGTLQAWKSGVAMPLAQHPVSAFALMSMLLPPLLRFMPAVGNPIFEFLSADNADNSAMLKALASVVGPTSYVVGLRDVQRDPEGLSRTTRDYPLLVEHAGTILSAMSKPKRAELFATIDYDLRRAPGGRVVLMAGRGPLRDACGMPTADDDIITLPAASGPIEGSTVPDRSPAFSDALSGAVAANHGHAYPEFLARLREALRPNGKRVQATIDREFARLTTGTDALDGGSVNQNAVRAFAAVYVAGYMAKLFGVLPRRVHCKRMTHAAFDLYRRAESVAVPFVARLEALIASGELLTVSRETDRAAQSHAAATALGTLTISRNKRLIKIPPANIEKVIPDWKRISHQHEVREPNGPLKRDGKNLTTWGKLAPGMERTRLHVFELPAISEPGGISSAGTE